MRLRPFCSLILLSLLASPMPAQTTLPASAPLRAAPGGRVLVTLAAGTRVSTGAARDGSTEVTVEGFVDSSVVRSGRADFPLIVTREGARLREEGDASGRILASLPRGMGLSRVSRRGNWIRVRRTGWIATAHLRASPKPVAAMSGTPPRVTAPPARASEPTRGPAPAAPRPAAPRSSHASAPGASAGATEPLLPGALRPASRIALRSAPDAGRVLGTVDTGAIVLPLARERGWVRVRVEGWIPERDVLPVDTALRVALSAADVRTDPEGTRGKVVRWDVTVYALQRGDPLRRDLAPNEPYMLARGPGEENSLLYLAVPPSLVHVARGLPAMAEITVTARIRNGRSEPVGVPLLDVQSITRR